VLGFTLHSLNTFIYKILEGYYLFARIPWFKRRQLRKYEKLESELLEVEGEIIELLNKIEHNQAQVVQLNEISRGISKNLNSIFLLGSRRKREGLEEQLSCVSEQIRNLQLRIEENEDRLQQLEDQRYYIVSEMHLRFPLSKDAILSTGFGNILRAAETYPEDRYGIDAVRLWPRLVYVIPESYYEKVDQSNNGLAFLVNCSILSLLMGLMSVLAAIYQLYLRLGKSGKVGLMYFIVKDDIEYNPGVYLERICYYCVIFVFTLVMFYIFYRGSLPLVMQYGNMIRSSYDLFRMQLLEELNLELPEDSVREHDLWSKISEFIAIGERRGALIFDYQLITEGSDNS
jgi:hypothetical protein